jgi:hypothetical protein
LVKLSETLAELHGSLLSGDPNEILRVAESACLLADGLRKGETAALLADYAGRETLSALLAQVKTQARLCLIVASSALRVGKRTMAALRGTREYGPTGQRILQSADRGLSEAG